MKHKGYNEIVTSSNLAQKFKYNGVEYEQGLGINLYEMDLRSYDPAIARFNGIDPVTHHSQGTSVAFDNNPIFYADPSGANSTYGADGLTNDQWMTLSGPEREYFYEMNYGTPYGGDAYNNPYAHLPYYNTDSFDMMRNVSRLNYYEHGQYERKVRGTTIAGQGWFTSVNDPQPTPSVYLGLADNVIANNPVLGGKSKKYHKTKDKTMSYSNFVSIGTSILGGFLEGINKEEKFLHYLPKTNRLKFYDRAYVNQYTKNTKLNVRGSAILLFLNQAALTDDFISTNMTRSQYEVNTFMNVYGSVYPPAGIGITLASFHESFLSWWNSNIKVKDFFNELQIEFEYFRNNHE